MSRSPFEVIPLDPVKTIISHFALNDVLNLACTSKINYSIFQPLANELKALLAVTYGAEATLIKLIKQTLTKNPELIFHKGSIVDPRGRFIDSISAYQLIIFLCDHVMMNAIKPLIPPDMESLRQEQYNELGQGGADLIKIDKNPELITDIQMLREFKQTFTFFEQNIPITFSLLENPDAIIFYQDEQSKFHFYYVNQNTKKLEHIQPEANTIIVQQAFDTFVKSFKTMENNSSRRSSDAEHQLIQQTMKINLHREGIRYKRDGVWFQDSLTDFRLINKYRICMRLFDEATDEDADAMQEARQFWRQTVGEVQGEVMWVLQRICENNRPFHPLPDDFIGFKREFNFENYQGKIDKCFSKGKLIDDLGVDFSLFKGSHNEARADNKKRASAKFACWRLAVDLNAICKLVEIAKLSVGEKFKPNQDLESKKRNAVEFC